MENGISFLVFLVIRFLREACFFIKRSEVNKTLVIFLKLWKVYFFRFFIEESIKINQKGVNPWRANTFLKLLPIF